MKLSYEDKIQIYHLRQSGWTWTKISQAYDVNEYNLKYLVLLLRLEIFHHLQQKQLIRLIDKHGLESVCKGKNR